MTDFLYLDIETIPTTDAEKIAEIATAITAPKTMSKPETIAEWEAKTKPALVSEAVAKTSFSGAYGKVCCIGWAWNDAAAQTVIVALSEAATMKLAFEHITAEAPRHAVPTIVGHYVANFDLRFLMQRAIVLGITMPHWFPRDPKPWSREVLDTMTVWAGAKDTISLDNLCKVLGLPGKGDIDGSMVADMWKRQQFDAIAEYCCADVERVRDVHRKMQVAFGELAA